MRIEITTPLAFESFAERETQYHWRLVRYPHPGPLRGWIHFFRNVSHPSDTVRIPEPIGEFVVDGLRTLSIEDRAEGHPMGVFLQAFLEAAPGRTAWEELASDAL